MCRKPRHDISKSTCPTWYLCRKNGRNNDKINSYFLPTPTPALFIYTTCPHLPAMKDLCLISVVQLCEDGFAVNFYTRNYSLRKVKHVLIGYRYATTGLNLIYFDNPQPFPSVANHSALALSTPSPSPSNIYAYSVNKMTTKNDLVLYLHQAEWRPVPSTLIKAIYACFYAIWLGLTAALALKHLPKTIYTSKGHLRQEQKNLLSKQ